GVIWYELLTGRYPVKGTTRAEVRAHLRNDGPPPPRQYRPETPIAVEMLVLRSLQRNAADRPASAGELVDALKAPLPVKVASSPRPAWWRQWLGLKGIRERLRCPLRRERRLGCPAHPLGSLPCSLSVSGCRQARRPLRGRPA